MKNLITGIVIAKNEEAQIENCLKSLSFCDEIILVNNDSNDKTVVIAKKYNCKIVNSDANDFSVLRNIGKENAKGDWIFYLDADEIVSESLRQEILKTATYENCGFVYAVFRRNFFLQKEWPVKDSQVRLFPKKNLIKWYGVVHESPKFNGLCRNLKFEIIHYTHNSLEEMLKNTIRWSDYEADLRIRANHPRVVWWRILRMMVSVFWSYYFSQKGFKLGTVGLIESVYQSFSVFITYAKVWERQVKGESV